jgi:hypothetical protein
MLRCDDDDDDDKKFSSANQLDAWPDNPFNRRLYKVLFVNKTTNTP